jgi:tetratricopeptide (TPR) repeat protein
MRISVRNILVVTGLLMLAVSAIASEERVSENPDQLFHMGNMHYGKGEFDKAIVGYEKILISGYESGPVYFNLGNAYYKTGQLGKAVLEYERAKLLMPRDADLLSNYKYVQSQLRDSSGQGKGIWNFVPLRRYYSSFTVDTLIMVSSCMFFLLIIFLFSLIFIRLQKRYIILTVLFLSVMIILNTAIVWHKVSGAKTEAVIITESVDSHYAPFESSTIFFTLHEGMKVWILDEKDGWYRVMRGDGKRAWIPEIALERI